jgi:hypothetical protein
MLHRFLVLTYLGDKDVIAENILERIFSFGVDYKFFFWIILSRSILQLRELLFKA